MSFQATSALLTTSQSHKFAVVLQHILRVQAIKCHLTQFDHSQSVAGAACIRSLASPASNVMHLGLVKSNVTVCPASNHALA